MVSTVTPRDAAALSLPEKKLFNHDVITHIMSYLSGVSIRVKGPKFHGDVRLIIKNKEGKECTLPPPAFARVCKLWNQAWEMQGKEAMTPFFERPPTWALRYLHVTGIERGQEAVNTWKGAQQRECMKQIVERTHTFIAEEPYTVFDTLTARRGNITGPSCQKLLKARERALKMVALKEDREVAGCKLNVRTVLNRLGILSSDGAGKITRWSRDDDALWEILYYSNLGSRMKKGEFTCENLHSKNKGNRLLSQVTRLSLGENPNDSLSHVPLDRYPPEIKLCTNLREVHLSAEYGAIPLERLEEWIKTFPRLKSLSVWKIEAGQDLSRLQEMLRGRNVWLSMRSGGGTSDREPLIILMGPFGYSEKIPVTYISGVSTFLKASLREVWHGGIRPIPWAIAAWIRDVYRALYALVSRAK